MALLDAQGRPLTATQDKSKSLAKYEQVLDEIASIIGITGNFIPDDIPVHLRDFLKKKEDEINGLYDQVDALEQFAGQ